ncbi:MAG: hypothetical protein SFZ02_21340 [bacterium]|nr:hypothetical protein [bacterium]
MRVDRIGTPGVIDEVKDKLVDNFHQFPDKYLDLLGGDATAAIIIGWIRFRGNGSSQGVQVKLADLAIVVRCSSKTAQRAIEKGEKAGIVLVKGDKGTILWYKAFTHPQNHFCPDPQDKKNMGMLGVNSRLYKGDENWAKTDKKEEDLSSINEDDPKGSFLRESQVHSNEGQKPSSSALLGKDESIVQHIEIEADTTGQVQVQKMVDSVALEASSQTNSSANDGEVFIAPDGRKFANFDADCNTLPLEEVDEGITVEEVDDNSAKDRNKKNRTQSAIEKLIVQWMKAHGSTITSLSQQSIDKLGACLPDSQETLMQVGVDVFNSSQGQIALAGIALWEKRTHATPFNQNDIVNCLTVVYQDWRKVRDSARTNPEIIELELALIDALGFTHQTIPSKSLAYLQNSVIPQLFNGDCRAIHAKPLWEGMPNRQLQFITGEWTAKKSLIMKNTVKKEKYVPIPAYDPYAPKEG